MSYPSYDYTFESYQEEAKRTIGHADENENDSDKLLAVSALGVAGEAGEVADLIKNRFKKG